MTVEPEKLIVSYTDVHQLCQKEAVKIKEFKPDIMIAIGGGGFIPARILRTFLKEANSKNIQIQAIGLSLYEDIGSETTAQTRGVSIVKTQWLNFNDNPESPVAAGALVGKRVLIVDEVDDSRKTLNYALSELEKDINSQAKKLGRENETTEFGVFVLHNKRKTKLAQLPDSIMKSGRYFAGVDVDDVWLSYPWDQSFSDPKYKPYEPVAGEKYYLTYENVHYLCETSAPLIRKNRPDVMIAIGGGGFIPARMLRTVLKEPNSKNIPIQAIGLSLYEDLGTNTNVIGDQENAGVEVIKTQWLDFNSLENHAGSMIGKRILIVDEVDDTRSTLHYALAELEHDLAAHAARLGVSNENTSFSIFVLHNKDKPKRAQLPQDLLDHGYIAAKTLEDCWIAYPWESKDIHEQYRLVSEHTVQQKSS